MSEEGTQTTPVDPPAPAPAAPAPEVVRSNSGSYDSERRARLAEWASEPDLVVETIEALEPDEPDEPPADPVEPEADAGDPMLAMPADGDDDVKTPTPEEAVDVAEPAVPGAPVEAVEPQKPRPFAVKAGEEEFSIPEDLTFTYKADGAERTRTPEEVIRFAQLGENFDRRSRELAERSRQQEQTYQQTLTQAQEQLNTAWSEFMGLTQRFLEDEDFREEYLEEYERLQQNPDEIQMRLKAQRADVLEAQFSEQKKAQDEQWNKQVWTTVDTILDERLGDFDPEIKGNVADRIRNRFYHDYSQRGDTVLSEAYLGGLIQEERGIIDRAVARARAEAEASIAPAVAKAKVEAVVENRNKTTDQSLQRVKDSKVTVPHAPPAVPVNATKAIRTMGDASKALKDWANT